MAIKSKWKINVSDVPNSIPIHQYIYDKTDFLIQTKKFKNYFKEDYIITNLKYNFLNLSNDIKAAIDLYGTYPFNYANKKIDHSYMSISLNYNPNSIDKISSNPHLGTLGSSLSSFKSTNQHLNNHLGKNTYNDTLSFNQKTNITNYKAISEFLNGLNRTMIRSRISILDGKQSSTRDISYGWHNDELIFLNLRINIPIQSSENYFIQILDNNSFDQSNLSEFNLVSGNVYAYDTHKYHRACCKKEDSKPRINLILGISPWFDFDHETNQWVSNEYYGEMHPFEMLAENKISNFIGKY